MTEYKFADTDNPEISNHAGNKAKAPFMQDAWHKQLLSKERSNKSLINKDGRNANPKQKQG